MNANEKNLGFWGKIFLEYYCYPPPGLPEPECNFSYNSEKPLEAFERHLGDLFRREITDKTVLDVGCGRGYEVIGAMARGAARAIGADIRPVYGEGKKLAKKLSLENKVSFTTTPIRELEPRVVDVALSQNSFEHFSDPGKVLDDVFQVLKPGGKFVITFSPPWLNPYGVHLDFMVRYPWAHLLFSEKTILEVRKLYRSDGAESYADVEGGLNKMTIRKFTRLIEASPFELERLVVTPMKIVPNFFRHIPILNEFTSSAASAILLKPADS